MSIGKEKQRWQNQNRKKNNKENDTRARQTIPALNTNERIKKRVTNKYYKQMN